MFASPPLRFHVPHPAISLATWLVVEDAIRVAWVQIRKSDFVLDSADEDTITQRLREILVDEVYNSGRVEGFDDSLLHILTREAKIRSYDGTHLDKMPDLHVGIVGRRNVNQSQDGIFVECKPVDATHAAGSHYCSKGVIRFVNGDYAWAMTTAMMVGYAINGYAIDPKLIKALEKSTLIKTTSMPIPCAASQTVLFCDQTHITIHERDFKYEESGILAPNIAIRHLWLRR